MATIWKGAIAFGLVHIPVHLEPAVRDDERVHFRQLHGADLSPIRNERVCQRDGEPVAWADIVKGYEYAKGKYVVVTDDDLASVAVASTRTIDLLDFVAADAIDPRYFEKPYVLLPNPGGEKGYALLREAIDTTGMIGIGKVVIRQHEHLVAIRSVGEALMLEIMRFVTELVDVSAYTFPNAEAVRPQERQMAEQLVRNLAQPFDPSRYRDEYQAALRAMIQAKLNGERLDVAEVTEPEGTHVLDLMARLQESLAHTQHGRGKGGRGTHRTRTMSRPGTADGDTPSPRRARKASATRSAVTGTRATGTRANGADEPTRPKRAASEKSTTRRRKSA
jgi:DNA end-binding protein Ku